jgi:hypothetical protein
MDTKPGDSTPKHRPGIDGPLTDEQAAGVLKAAGVMCADPIGEQVAIEINRLCAKHGYGLVPQVAKWVEARWRGQL